MNNLWTVQQSIYAALVAVPTTYPVYDAVPQGVAKPYIVIGEYTESPDEELGWVSTDATLTFHAWSAVAGKKQIHAMLEFIRARLDGMIFTDTWLCVEDFVEIMEDEGSTAASRLYHGVARYQLRVQEGTGGVAPPNPESESIVFNADGSITETFSNGLVVTTTFPSEGVIVRVYGAPVSETVTTTFNADGTISEVTS